MADTTEITKHFEAILGAFEELDSKRHAAEAIMDQAYYMFGLQRMATSEAESRVAKLEKELQESRDWATLLKQRIACLEEKVEQLTTQ
jgi:uncharacterized small protein (DUF1192 family)